MHDGGTPGQPDPEVERKLGLGRAGSRKTVRVLQVILALALLAGLGVLGQRYFAQRAASMRPTYELAKAKRADIDLTVSATGTVKGLSTVEVGAEVTGKILRVHVG